MNLVLWKVYWRDDHDQVVLMGDFNADIRRSDRRFARLLNSFLICHNLTAVGLEDASATTAQKTWHSHDFRCESWIDHICVSQSLKGMIEDFKIREGECVTSDHWPVEIYCYLRQKELRTCW